MTLTRWLLGSTILVYSPYSLPCCCSILSYVFAYIAIPPLLPLLRRSSTMLYPGMVGDKAVWVSQVSCTQSMSISCYAKMAYSFNRVRPRMFMLATVMPYVIHFLRCVFELCFLLREPFVRCKLLCCSVPGG